MNHSSNYACQFTHQFIFILFIAGNIDMQTTCARCFAVAGYSCAIANFLYYTRRFNYLFIDGHVATHKITETVGRGTTNNPFGMWTMVAGD